MIGLILYVTLSYSAIAIVTGLLLNKPAICYTAAAAAIPVSLYLAAAPLLSLIPLAFPVMLAGCGLLCRRGKRFYAVILSLPYLATLIYLVAAVLAVA